MEQYPDLPVFIGDYNREDLDGRRNSRTADGMPKVQILWDGRQSEIKITHPQLDRAQSDEIVSFYERNIVLEFEFLNPEDDKTYICMFYSPPRYGRWNRGLKDVSFTLAGYLKNG